jgi:hypothetical protein
MSLIRVLRDWWRSFTESDLERRQRRRSPQDVDIEELPKGDPTCDHEPTPYPDQSIRCNKCGRFFSGDYGGYYQLNRVECGTHSIEFENGYIEIDEIRWEIEEAHTTQREM